MTTSRVNKATATGLALVMISIGAGVSSAGVFALLLSFAGVLAGASSLIFVGVQMSDDAPTAPTGLLAAGVLCLRRKAHNLGLVGLLMASAAASATAAAGRETAVVLCFCGFILLLSGLTLVNIGVLLGEQEQEH